MVPTAATTYAAGAYHLALLPDWLDPEQIIRGLGPYAFIGVLLIIFAECGLLVGFFLPGDSLLFTAGLMIGTGWIDVPLWLACVLLVIAACVGNLTGYAIGRRAGPALFNRPDSRLFKREYVDKTHEFFERYGARAIILARFVPIVRTFITVIAGVGKMDFRKYAIYTTIGGVLWAAGLTILGFFLGNIAFIRENLEAMVVLIVLISVLPIGVEYLRARSQNRKDNRSSADVTDPEPAPSEPDRH